MPKLHELLATENTKSEQAKKCLADLTKTFKDKQHQFEKTIKAFTPVGENEQTVVEEEKDLNSTIPFELKWISSILAPAIDVAYQVDEANMEARADLVLEDDQVLARNVPSTALLRLQHRIDELQKFISAIPTLDPVLGWTAADDQRSKNNGKGVYVSRPKYDDRTKKEQVPIVLYPATAEHPAQTQLIVKEVLTGKIVVTHFSGKLTVDQKGNLLERVEKLNVAVKAAISRANLVDGDKSKKIAKTLLDYVFGDLIA